MASSAAHSARSDCDCYACGRRMRRHSAFRNADSYTMAHGDSNGNGNGNGGADSFTNSNPATDRDPDSPAEADPDTTTAAAACLCPCAGRATGITSSHRTWEYEPDAGQPDL